MESMRHQLQKNYLYGVYPFFVATCFKADTILLFQGKSNRDKSLVELRRHLIDVFIPKCRQYLVLFPEGGFLRNRKAVSQA